MAATPTRRKRRLGRFLRDLRERAGVTAGEAATELKAVESTVSRYESGTYRPQWPSVKALLDLYGADEADWAKALSVWEAASIPTPQVRLPAGAPKIFRELVRNEREADRVLVVAPSVVPGLLQTADYARAVHASAQRSRDPEANVEHFVNARLERQKLLDGPDALRLDVCLDEAVLHREVGGAAVLREQLLHLLSAADKPNVTVRLIPYSAGAYGSMSGSCLIIESEDSTGNSDTSEPPVVYLEHAAGGAWAEDEGDVQHFQAMFKDVSAQALSPEDTAEAIQEQVRRLSSD